VTGSIHVVCGEMYSGKSQELARLIERATIADRRVMIFYPTLSERDSTRDIVSRLQHLKTVAICPVDYDVDWSRVDIARFDTIALDEAQFFSHAVVDAVKAWRQAGKTVIISGLDLDVREQPFGPMGDLLCLANTIAKLHAVCVDCKGQESAISYRITDQDEQIVVGESEYIPLCFDCYYRRKGAH
jgi:thymidine kinase